MTVNKRSSVPIYCILVVLSGVVIIEGQLSPEVNQIKTTINKPQTLEKEENPLPGQETLNVFIVVKRW